MQKPNGYDEAHEMGTFTPVELGGHYAKILQVAERQSSTGKDMIVVLFDFIDPDKQKKYHSTRFQNDTNPDRKWPFNGTKYIMVYDYNDPSKTSRDFKTFCTSYEKSNNTTIQWGGGNWAAQFKGKRIGIIYRAEENEYDGQTSMRNVPFRFCSWDAVKDATVPKPKYLNGRAPASAPAPTGIDGFVAIPEGTEEAIPF